MNGDPKGISQGPGRPGQTVGMPERPRLSLRTNQLAPSATLAIDAQAKAMVEAGEPVISFGAGEPDFPTPSHAVAVAVEACGNPANHHYSPTAGLAELREAICEKTFRDSHIEVGPKQVLVTNGAKHAIFNALATLVDPGDEVLIPSPWWVTYPETVRLLGGVPVEVATTADSGFRASVEQLEALCTDRTKLVVITSPSNPTGTVYSGEELREIGQWAGQKGLWVLSDEIYEHLVFGDHAQHSIVAVAPELEDRWVVVNGVSKSYAMTGWRLGWMIGPEDVVSAASNLQSQTTSNVCNVSQRAAIAALTGHQHALSEMRAAFDTRRKLMHRMLTDIEGVSCVEPFGAFYCFPDVSALLGRPMGADKACPATTMELASLLLEEAQVAVVPGEAFSAPGYLRLSYALSDEDLYEGMSRLAGFLAPSS